MSDRGTVTTQATAPYIGQVLIRGQKPAPTVPTVGQIWPRGNQIQR